MKFPFVDCQRVHGARRSKWTRIAVCDVGGFFGGRLTRDGCFVTVQRFAANEPQADEPHYAPLFFDFDALDLKTAQRETKITFDFLSSMIGRLKAIEIVYTGNRGFHLTIPSELFGLRPGPNATREVKVLAALMRKRLQLTTLDMNVYSRRRMWRLVGSRHEKTGLFATVLSPKGLMLSTSEIQQLAQSSTPIIGDDGTTFSTIDKAEAWARSLLDRRPISIKTNIHPISVTGGNAACVTDLLNSGLKMPHSRNRATVNLACWFKAQGRSKSDAINLLSSWAVSLPPHLSSSSQARRLANSRAVVGTVYRYNHYRFSCSAILSLGADTRPVACAGPACPLHWSNRTA